MPIDPRPAVTVIGELERSALGGLLIVLDDFLGTEFQEGDEVEVEIRKHERFDGSLFPAPEESDE